MFSVKSKIHCKGSIPFWVGDIIGLENYNKLQAGDSIELSKSPDPQILEFIDISEVKSTSSEKKEVKSKKNKIKE